MTRIEQVSLPNLDCLAHLVAEGELQGYSFMPRLAREYASGVNRFDAPGEALFIAYQDDTLVGVCGLNRDPYLNDPRIGRVRHLYVARSARRLGAGRALILAVITAAERSFDWLTLRTEYPAAAALYLDVGFSGEPRFAEATHWRALTSV